MLGCSVRKHLLKELKKSQYSFPDPGQKTEVISQGTERELDCVECVVR